MDPNLNTPAEAVQELPQSKTPNEIEETKKVSKKVILLVSLLLAILIPTSIYLYSRYKSTVSYPATLAPTPVAKATPSPKANSFSNIDGGYSFTVPAGWTSEVNQYAAKNTLFGPNASSNSGLGGVEVVKQDSLASYLQMQTEAQYSTPTDITVDGVTGAKRTYTGVPGGGTQVILFSSGIIYNIYINSQKAEDLNNFDQILSTFKFTNPQASIDTSSWKTYNGKYISFKYPPGWNPKNSDPINGGDLESVELGIPGNPPDQTLGFSSVSFSGVDQSRCINKESITISGKNGYSCMRQGSGYVSYDFIAGDFSVGNPPNQDSFGTTVTVAKEDPQLQQELKTLINSITINL